MKSSAGITAGGATYVAFQKLVKMTMHPYGKWWTEGLRKVKEGDELNAVKTAVKTAFDQTGLKAKGFELRNTSSEERVFEVSKELNEKIAKILDKRAKKAGKILPKNLVSKIRQKHSISARKDIDRVLNVTLNGENAFCLCTTKDICANLEKMPLVAFHEMGHGLNSLQTGGKILQITRFAMTKAGIPLVLAVALLKRKKQEGENPDGGFDKATTFIKDNSGKLTFAAFIPMLAEEGLASIKGAKMAKNAGLSANILKKINSGNARAWLSYLFGALTFTSAVKLAVAVKDRIAEGRQRKNNGAAENITA